MLTLHTEVRICIECWIDFVASSRLSENVPLGVKLGEYAQRVLICTLSFDFWYKGALLEGIAQLQGVIVV